MIKRMIILNFLFVSLAGMEYSNKPQPSQAAINISNTIYSQNLNVQAVLPQNTTSSVNLIPEQQTGVKRKLELAYQDLDNWEDSSDDDYGDHTNYFQEESESWALKIREHINPNNPLQCNACKKNYPSLFMLEDHIQIQHLNEPFVCAYCNQQFNSRLSLGFHQTQKLCTFCSAIFCQDNLLKKHIQNMHSDCPLGVLIPTMIAEASAAIAKQAQKEYSISVQNSAIEHEEEPLDDQISNFSSYISPHSLQIQDGLDEIDAFLKSQKPLESDGKEEDIDYFDSQKSNDVLSWQSYVDPEDSLQYKDCRKGYSSTQVLRDHIEIKHLNKVAICDECKKSFASQCSLYHHLNTSKEICKHCNKSFCLMGLLKYHLISEHDESGFVCDTCKTAYDTKKVLAYHIKKKHTNVEKPICQTCGKELCSQKTLADHIASIHLNINYLCVRCHANLGSIQALNKHKANEVTCPKCFETFCTKKSLKYHNIKIHNDGNNNFLCDPCKKFFGSRIALNRHLRDKH